MKIVQKVVLLYLFIGMGVGLVSNFFVSPPYSSLALASSLPFAIYLISLAPLVKTVRQKETKWLVFNSFLTFLLVWLTVWVFLYNVM